ncbi:hypothetical protein QQF64_034887 [Cirrhinus molitorella]|uniref:Secreted protein n=1 Tax=Cirrhinus molitorella TaxID=172907 RepID=A0ABR3NE68_9TELE
MNALLLLLGSFISSIMNPRRFSLSSSAAAPCFFICHQIHKSITASSSVTRNEQIHGTDASAHTLIKPADARALQSESISDAAV